MKKYIMAIGLALCLFTYNSILAFSVPVEELEDEVQTNNIPNWPTGPELNAKSAVLIEANSGIVLYAKNMDERMYPASTTKLMTALVAMEHSDLDEMVKFSYDAVFSLESGSSNIGIDPGQSMTMKECLYGIMVGSANEVANAIAEHTGGSIDGFVDMMNDKVKELNLQNTHFTNPNGLHDEEHYTSAYDLAIIAREFFKNDILSNIGNTPNYHFVATDTQPDDFYVRNKHKLINGDIPYTGVKGGKTGYTSIANECLVTCSEQNDMKLICVIMNETSPEQFTDTVKLFDYGYSNFTVMNIAENENKYSIQSKNLFPTTIDILGSSSQLLELNKNNYIIMPKNITFNDLLTEIDYNTKDSSEVAYINYSYHDVYLGYGTINRKGETKITSAFDSNLTEEEQIEIIEKEQPIVIDVVKIGMFIFSIFGFLIILSLIISVLINYNILDNAKIKKRNRRRNRKIRK